MDPNGDFSTNTYRPSIRWVPVQNTDPTPAPPYAIMAVVGLTTINGVAVVQVACPSSQQTAYLLNGGTPIPPGWIGQGHETFPAIAGYNADEDETPVVGEMWGPEAGTWLLSRHRVGYLVLGGATSQLVNVTKQDDGCRDVQILQGDGTGRYSWREMLAIPGGDYVVRPSGMTGNYQDNPAWERNLVTDVPAGSIVRICPGAGSSSTVGLPTTTTTTTTTTTSSPPTTAYPLCHPGTTTPAPTTTTTTTLPPHPLPDWRFSYCCGTSETTTTTAGPAIANSCVGNCQWTWDSSSSTWTLYCSDCQTQPGCVCQQPTYCGSTNGEITNTGCVPYENAAPCCSTTTTTEPATTTTTIPPGCGGTCTWIYQNTGRSDGGSSPQYWLSINGCSAICPCAYPPITGEEECGDTYVTNCVVPEPTTTEAPPGCSGSCTWQWVPTGNEDGTFDWALYGYTCGDGCTCYPPDYDGDPCNPNGVTSCLSVDGGPGGGYTTSNPCSPTTCAPSACCGQCIFSGDGSGGWDLVRGNCTPDMLCGCVAPSYSSSSSSQTQSVLCAPGVATTTTTTTTITTSTTTTTAGPCSGTCIYQCEGDFNAHLISSACSTGCSCPLELEDIVFCENAGTYFNYSACNTTTTAAPGTSTSNGPSTLPP